MRPQVWFVIGFLLVFVGMLLFDKMYTMLPSGQGVIQCPLWRYYGIELHKAFMPHALGPGDSGGSAFGETLFFHFLFSVVGGFVFVGASKLLSKRKGPKA